MPLYWSQATNSLTAASFSMTGPGTYMDQAALTFGVQSPALKIKGVKVAAFGEVVVPVAGYCPKDPVASMFNAPVLRAGVKTIF